MVEEYVENCCGMCCDRLPTYPGVLVSVFLVLLSLQHLQMSYAETAYPVTDFGARGDGTTLATIAIQKAIDTAAQTGAERSFSPRGNT